MRALHFFGMVSVVALSYSLFITWQYVKVLQQSHVASTHDEHHHIVASAAMHSGIAAAALASLRADEEPASKSLHIAETVEQPRRAGAHDGGTASGTSGAPPPPAPPPTPSPSPPGPSPKGEHA